MNFIKRIEEVDNLEIGNKALNLKDSEFIQQLWCSAVYFVY